MYRYNRLIYRYITNAISITVTVGATRTLSLTGGNALNNLFKQMRDFLALSVTLQYTYINSSVLVAPTVKRFEKNLAGVDTRHPRELKLKFPENLF